MSHHVLSVLYSIVGRRGALSLVTLLVTLFMTLTAQIVQAEVDPYGDEACITPVSKDRVIDGKHYRVITINKNLAQARPKECSLRTAHSQYPIIIDGKPLEMEAWLRSVFAANQGDHPTVLCRCVPQHGRSEVCSIGEDAFCSEGKATNIFAVPSNGWKAYILIPSQIVLTQEQKNVIAAKAACVDASSEAAVNACIQAGHLLQTPGPVTPSPTSDAEIFKTELKNANLRLAEMTAKLAGMGDQLAETKKALDEERSSSTFWFILFLTAFLTLSIVCSALLWSVRSGAKLGQQLNEEREAVAALTLENQELRQSLAQSAVLLHRQVEDDRKAIDEIKAASKDKIEQVKKENSDLREELKQRNGEKLELEKALSAARSIANDVEDANKKLEAAKAELDAVEAQTSRLVLLRTSDVEILSSRAPKIGAQVESTDRLSTKLQKALDIFVEGLGSLIQGENEHGLSMVPPSAVPEDQAKRLVAKIVHLVELQRTEIEALRQVAPNVDISVVSVTTAPSSTETVIDDNTKRRVVDEVVDLLRHWVESLRSIAQYEERVTRTVETISLIHDPANVVSLKSGLEAYRIELEEARKTEAHLNSALYNLRAECLTLREPTTSSDSYVDRAYFAWISLKELIDKLNNEIRSPYTAEQPSTFKCTIAPSASPSPQDDGSKPGSAA